MGKGHGQGGHEEIIAIRDEGGSYQAVEYTKKSVSGSRVERFADQIWAYDKRRVWASVTLESLINRRMKL